MGHFTIIFAKNDNFAFQFATSECRRYPKQPVVQIYCSSTICLEEYLVLGWLCTPYSQLESDLFWIVFLSSYRQNSNTKHTSSWLPESLDACGCDGRNSGIGSGANSVVNSSHCVSAGSSDCAVAGSSDCAVSGSSHCSVKESSTVFATPTAATWLLLQSLQIPVNSQALSNYHKREVWKMHGDYLIMHLLMTTWFSHFNVFALRFEFPWFLSEIVLFVALFVVLDSPLI